MVACLPETYICWVYSICLLMYTSSKKPLFFLIWNNLTITFLFVSDLAKISQIKRRSPYSSTLTSDEEEFITVVWVKDVEKMWEFSNRTAGCVQVPSSNVTDRMYKIIEWERNRRGNGRGGRGREWEKWGRGQREWDGERESRREGEKENKTYVSSFTY